ncbi:uncharacterized protein [Antedon mediterranea]|uniref:uncharacterized protein isoform X2 n=1 Tax=Antedon mediterranea TaxID=105859 RepID=UPI003AF7BA2A
MEKISTGDKLDVVVTSVESVSAIFATLSENGLALMELQDALMNRYSILPSNQTYSPQVGEICATKFVDNYWYRGRILAVNGSKVKVLYVDYGNQEVISVTDCHPLSKYLLKLDEQLVTCSLANSRGKDVMKSVKDLEETRIKIQVSGKVNGILMIELLTGDNTKTESKSPLLPTPSQDSPTKFQEKSSPVMRQGYSNTTPQERSPSSSNQDSYRQRSTYNNRSPMNGDVKSPENYGNQEQRGKNSYRNDGKTSTYNGYQHQPSNFQKFNNQNIPPSPVMAEKCEMMSLKEGKIETAMIYVANGPSSFYVQVNQPTSVRAIQQISDPMSEDYSNIKEVHLPVVGELCIAKFSDDYWYRAEVLSIGTNKLNVKFIDYGNIDPVKKEDVRRIKEPYSKIPVVAIHCALHGAPITDNPKDKQSQEFAEKFVNKVVGVKRVGITPKGVSLVEIFDKKGSNRPINADYIVPVQSPKLDKNVPTVVFRELELQCETKATVMYVVSPSEFYCTRVEGDVPTTVESTKYVTNDPLDARSEPKTLIISDSIVRDFDEDILENTKVVCLRGRRVIDIKHHLDEAPVHEFSTVIIHGSTNDCTTEADEKFAEGVYDEIFDDLKRRAPDLTIAFSTVCPRFDDGSFQAHVNKLNYKLRELSVQSGCIQINNDVNFLLNDGTVDRSTLDRRGLHLSRVGSLRLLKNINDKHRIIRDKKETQNVQCSNPISDILALKNLMESLNIRYANKGKNYDYVPRKGEMCCSIFAEDQSWYRALVLDVNVDNQCASVQYVDYGNKAKVAFDSVHPLDKEFSTTPCLAIKCCLAGTRPDQGSAWSEGAIERVKDVLGQGEKLLHIKLMSHDDGWNYIEVADPTTNEVLNKVFQNASPVTGIHDTPLSSHRPAFLPSPSTDTDALLLEKYEQKKRELEELQNMLQKH